jgi:F-type H+-transporting ATPase subunit epsilon
VRAADLDEAAAQRAKKEAEDALSSRADAMEVSEAQTKLAQALAQLQALERLRKNLKH